MVFSSEEGGERISVEDEGRIRQMPRKITGHPNLLSVIYFFGIHVMMGETVISHLFPFCPFLSVITVRINRDPSSWKEFSPDFNILRVHKIYQIFHNLIAAVLMKISMISVRKEIQF